MKQSYITMDGLKYFDGTLTLPNGRCIILDSPTEADILAADEYDRDIRKPEIVISPSQQRLMDALDIATKAYKDSNSKIDSIEESKAVSNLINEYVNAQL